MGLFSKTTKTVEFDYKGHQIEIGNWWRMLPTQSYARITVDGKILEESRKFTHPNPDEPIFSLQNISVEITSIDVFMIGAFKIKFAVNINGEIIYREDISYADSLQKKYLGYQ